jgi:hypothetical protein
MARFDPEWMTETVAEQVEETVTEEMEKSVGETVSRRSKRWPKRSASP